MQMNFIEALSHYGINFDMETFPLGYMNETGQHTTLEGVHGMRRKDTLEPLQGVSVGARYNVIQTSSYADIGDRIVGQSGAEFIKGGVLKDGRVAYLQAKFPDSIRVKGDNTSIDKYLTFVNSYDGSSPFYILPTMLRLICTNQFAALSRDARANGMKISHTSRADERIQQADQALLEVMEAYRTVEIKVNQLAVTPFGDKQIDLAARRLFKVDDDLPEEDIHSRTLTNINKVKELALYGNGQDSVRGTGYAFYQGAVEYADWERSLRQTTDRFESSLIGSGALLKDRAMRVVEQVIAQAA